MFGPMTAVPVAAATVFLNVPMLVNTRPLDTASMLLFPCTSNVPEFVMDAPVCHEMYPETQLMIPELVRGRFSVTEDALLTVSVPDVEISVVPEPFMVPPFQVTFPYTLRVPEPLSVPPFSNSTPGVVTPLVPFTVNVLPAPTDNVSVPAEMPPNTSTFTVAFTSSVTVYVPSTMMFTSSPVAGATPPHLLGSLQFPLTGDCHERVTATALGD